MLKLHLISKVTKNSFSSWNKVYFRNNKPWDCYFSPSRDLIAQQTAIQKKCKKHFVLSFPRFFLSFFIIFRANKLNSLFTFFLTKYNTIFIYNIRCKRHKKNIYKKLYIMFVLYFFVFIYLGFISFVCFFLSLSSFFFFLYICKNKYIIMILLTTTIV